MLNPGTMLSGRYEIIEMVGSGGMSEVYKAKCHVLNRFVAIKVLKPEFSSDVNFVTKFRIEAQSAAGLSHPNIVNVYDVGEDNGVYYIVMELVEGITLKEYIQKHGRIEPKEAIDFAIQIAQGVQAAHEHHTIHRDIKPDNIIYNKDKNTYSLIDGGICKNTEDEIKLTVTNKPLGTPRYMAPEQMKVAPNEVWNFQTDLYPLGLIAIEMFVPNIRFESNPELRDLHFVIAEWEKQCKSENDLTYFKKIIVNLSNETRALRFNNLEKLKNELLHWKEVLK